MKQNILNILKNYKILKINIQDKYNSIRNNYKNIKYLRNFLSKFSKIKTISLNTNLIVTIYTYLKYLS